MNRKKGVCQAYCELFYRLGLSIGIDVRIVSGYVKERDGKIGEDLHAWIVVNNSGHILKENLFPESVTYYSQDAQKAKFNVTRGLSNKTAIIIDPTWGAGSIINGRFVRKEYCKTWFDVDPFWMAFTHLPERPADQLLGNYTINRAQFERLPYLTPECEGYGFQSQRTLTSMVHDSNITLPEIMPSYSEYISFEDIPVQKKLEYGKSYKFLFLKKRDCTLAIFCDKSEREDDAETNWQNSGKYSQIIYTVTSREDISFGLQKNRGNDFDIFLNYTVQ